MPTYLPRLYRTTKSCAITADRSGITTCERARTRGPPLPHYKPSTEPTSQSVWSNATTPVVNYRVPASVGYNRALVHHPLAHRWFLESGSFLQPDLSGRSSMTTPAMTYTTRCLTLRRVLETLNIPIHLEAGDPLDVAGQVARRVDIPLLVFCRIFRPVINYLVTSILFLFQTASNGGAAVWAKDSTHIFFGRLAGLLSVYGRHRSPRTSIGGLVLRLCPGGL
jgi:hypothetical protein